MVKLRKNAPDLGQKYLADFRYSHMMRAAIYKRYTEFAFEPLDLLTECGLNDVFPRRRTTEMALLRQSHEIPQLTQFHSADARRIQRGRHEYSTTCFQPSAGYHFL
jgi:hypothetical protein